jgi:hypothetical protein
MITRTWQRCRNLMYEAPFVCPVQIFAWLHRVASRHGALVRSARSVSAEFVCVTVDFGRYKLAVRVERIEALPYYEKTIPPHWKS